jgi:hypothetical protein
MLLLLCLGSLAFFSLGSRDTGTSDTKLAVFLPTSIGSAESSLSDFEKLHRDLSGASELWRTIPWKTSIQEARSQAAREKKPIYLVSRSGHPLGSVETQGIFDRGLCWSDPEVINVLRTRFVPVAVDQHVHRRRKDPEGQIFAKLTAQVPGKSADGAGQGVYIFDPDGKLVAFSHHSSAEEVKKVLYSTLQKYAPTLDLPKLEEGPLDARYPYDPPAGTLVVDVTAKVLGGYPTTTDPLTLALHRSLGQDHLWITKEEADALAGGTFPDLLKARIARFHLVDDTRGEPTYWQAGEVKQLELTYQQGKLFGQVHLETASGERGYIADMQGIVDVKGGKVVRFDLLARGQCWGAGPYAGAPPPGRFPLAVAFTLVNVKTDADKVGPAAARHYLKGYLRVE